MYEISAYAPTCSKEKESRKKGGKCQVWKSMCSREMVSRTMEENDKLKVE